MGDRLMQTRRHWLTACAGATAGLAALAGCTSDDENDDDETGNGENGDGPGGFNEENGGEYGVWPMAHYDAANTAVAPNSGPDSEPEEEWSIEFDGEPTIPVVANGMIYVGTIGGTYHGIDISDRETIWGHNTGEFDVPAVSNNAVYISGDGIEALDHEDGERIWTSEHNPLFNLRISNEIVYGYTSHYVYGIEEKSGNEVVEIETSGDIDYMTVGENNVYVESHQENDDYRLEAYDKESGNLSWNHNTDDLWDTQFTLVDDTIYAIDDRSFISVDAEDGEKQVVKEFDPETGASPRRPTVYDEVAYVPTSEYFELPAIDLHSQSELQEWDYEGAIAAWRNVVSDDILYVWGSENPQSGLTLHAIDLENGEVNWAFETRGAEDPGVPVVLEDRIVFSDDGEEQITVLN